MLISHKPIMLLREQTRHFSAAVLIVSRSVEKTEELGVQMKE